MLLKFSFQPPPGPFLFCRLLFFSVFLATSVLGSSAVFSDNDEKEKIKKSNRKAREQLPCSLAQRSRRRRRRRGR